MAFKPRRNGEYVQIFTFECYVIEKEQDPDPNQIQIQAAEQLSTLIYSLRVCPGPDFLLISKTLNTTVQYGTNIGKALFVIHIEVLTQAVYIKCTVTTSFKNKKHLLKGSV